MLNVFISHSSEDNEVARKMANYLRRDGAEVWIHYTQLIIESVLPKTIRRAIAASDVVLLIWSRSTMSASCIQSELYSALMFKKPIILCQIDDARKWDSLEGLQQISFVRFDQGYFELASCLHIQISEKFLSQFYKSFEATPVLDQDTFNDGEQGVYAQGAESTAAAPERQAKADLVLDLDVFTEPEQLPAIEIAPVNESPILLADFKKKKGYREQPAQLSEADVTEMICSYNFFDAKKNENGNQNIKMLEYRAVRGEEVVFDHDAGLMWQKSGSVQSMWFDKATQWIEALNRIGFAGYHDWRLPTLEEAMSLMKKERLNGDIYIDSTFNKNQTSIWTSDLTTAGSRAWVVFYNYGSCYANCFDFNNFVRAVRRNKRLSKTLAK